MQDKMQHMTEESNCTTNVEIASLKGMQGKTLAQVKAVENQ